MKPRTKRQKEVYDLSKIVLKINKDIEQWAQKECNDHYAFATKKRYWCTNCGEVHERKFVKRKTIKCPSCKVRLEIKERAIRKYHQSYYVGFAELLGDYQVIRLFIINSNHRMNKKPCVSSLETIMQFIPNDHDKIEFVARARNMGQGDPTSGRLEIRKPSDWQWHIYNPCPYKFHPKSQFKQEYTKYGINHELRGLSFFTASRILPLDSRAETILKAKQYSLFNKCGDQPSKILKHWSSIKIAIRHKYYVADGGVWLDHLDLLEEAGKDLRNPKFVCSPTLFRDHQRMVAKKRKEEERLAKERNRLWKIQQREREEKRMMEDRQKFEQLKGHFFGLQFSKGDLHVKVLESIEEFKLEGDFHGHCVYTNRYYNKGNTLVMSASFKEIPVETVEVNLNSMNVTQSRGKHNEATKYHDAIVDLVNRNMYQIAQRMQGEQKNAG
ncbi:PcfJ domain-containing protein [Sphingobacterium sp. LRF_L2]|uniref:PcfJ domain-containing protein n=1 Tax=Sphingobacterium sp. LRF_L2 TaxID=3369421 RepID=UPI003F60BE13